MPRPPILIGREIYRRSTYGGRHPLAIPRVSLMLDLVRTLGWVREDSYVDAPRATSSELARFHDPAYISALHQTQTTPQLDPPTTPPSPLRRTHHPRHPPT